MVFAYTISEFIVSFNIALKGLINSPFIQGYGLCKSFLNQNPRLSRVLSFLNSLVYLLISQPGQIPFYPILTFDIKFRPDQLRPGQFLISKLHLVPEILRAIRYQNLKPTNHAIKQNYQRENSRRFDS